MYVGPLHKIQGYQGTEISADADLITVETYVQQGETILKNSFSYIGQDVKKMYILGYLGGLEGIFNDQTGPVLLSSYPLTHIYVHVKYGSNI